MKTHPNWIKRILGADETEGNADVLRRMRDDGDDLTEARDIEFNHLFDREADAIAFENAVRGEGYSKVDHDFWHEVDAWLTSVSIRMVPELAGITANESSLNEIALNLNGWPDGWGCMEFIRDERQ
ncbi:MAG TPA: ribonuclease E inhibitor RraB [Luteolibacter sp.]